MIPKHHTGFPNGDQLDCPVFNHNKGLYLKNLRMDGLCNPTIVIDVNDDSSLFEHAVIKYKFYLNTLFLIHFKII